jgi:hypothetical protein
VNKWRVLCKLAEVANKSWQGWDDISGHFFGYGSRKGVADFQLYESAAPGFSMAISN